MLKEKLLNLGFTPNQADTYLALIELGQTKVGPLIRRTGFHRNIIYRALEDLVAKKLVFKITKRGVTYFEPTDPTPLIEEQEIKKELAENIVSEIRKKAHVTESEVVVLKGEQGVIDLGNMVLKENEDLYLIGANGTWMKTCLKSFAEFQERMEKKRIKRHHLAIEETRNTPFSKLGNLEVKYLPDTFSSPLVIWIFGNYVAHALWEQPETIFVIKNQKIARDYHNYFEHLWNQDVQVQKGIKAFRKTLMNIVDTLQPEEEYHVLGANFGALYAKHIGGAIPEIFKEFHQYRIQKGVRARLLFHKGMEGAVKKYKENYKEYAQVRFLPYQTPSPSQQMVYGSKISIFIFTQQEPIIITIDNEAVARSFDGYFESLWKTGKKF